jgi:hypothetical protein
LFSKDPDLHGEAGMAVVMTVEALPIEGCGLRAEDGRCGREPRRGQRMSEPRKEYIVLGFIISEPFLTGLAGR